MNPLKSILWFAGAGLPALALALWFASAVSPSDAGADSPTALAQATPATSDANNATDTNGRQFNRLGTRPQAGDRFLERIMLRDVLGWQAMGLPHRPALDQMVQAREQEEWSRMLDFFKGNSANLYQLLQNRPPLPGTPARMALMRNWLNLKQLERTQPSLYDLRVQGIKDRDAVVGLLAQLMQAQRTGNVAQVAAIKQQIQDQEADVVDLNLRERQMRIKMLQDTIDQQRNLLSKDMANKDKLAFDRAHAVIARAERFSSSPSTRPSSTPPIQPVDVLGNQ